jgi:hypothetical protein
MRSTTGRRSHKNLSPLVREQAREESLELKCPLFYSPKIPAKNQWPDVAPEIHRQALVIGL